MAAFWSAFPLRCVLKFLLWSHCLVGSAQPCADDLRYTQILPSPDQEPASTCLRGAHNALAVLRWRDFKPSCFFLPETPPFPPLTLRSLLQYHL